MKLSPYNDDFRSSRYIEFYLTDNSYLQNADLYPYGIRFLTFKPIKICMNLKPDLIIKSRFNPNLECYVNKNFVKYMLGDMQMLRYINNKENGKR